MATITCKSPIFSRFIGSACEPVSHYVHLTRPPRRKIPITGVKPCSSRSSYLRSCDFGHGYRLKDSARSNLAFGLLGFNSSRILAVSGGGSDSGGGGGGTGDGGSGNGDGADGNNWSFFSWYMSKLAKSPVLTKAVTAALLTLIGDVICQLVIEKAASLDLKRTMMFTILGLVLVGPTLHFWYLRLSQLVTVAGAKGALLRLVLDQFLFSPLFIGFFLSTLLTLEGRPSEVIPKLQQEWFASVIANWKLWIPFQFLNFLFIPQQFQVLGANFIAIIWNVILSFKAHKEVVPK